MRKEDILNELILLEAKGNYRSLRTPDSTLLDLSWNSQ